MLAATGTVALEFDGCHVNDSNVIATVNADAWRAADRRTASIGSPAVLGIADRAIRLLSDAARSPSDGGGMDLRHAAQRLAREALFYVIQAQTSDGRSATLEHERC